VECWCDTVELELTKDEDKHCDRFSPGYGDFALEHQKDFARCLDMAKYTGITLSESLLMTPTKSVTAIIGLGASARTCGNKCMFCTKENCIYREVII
jgi:cobalamin-dependent methionine synthase I